MHQHGHCFPCVCPLLNPIRHAQASSWRAAAKTVYSTFGRCTELPRPSPGSRSVLFFCCHFRFFPIVPELASSSRVDILTGNRIHHCCSAILCWMGAAQADPALLSGSKLEFQAPLGGQDDQAPELLFRHLGHTNAVVNFSWNFCPLVIGFAQCIPCGRFDSSNTHTWMGLCCGIVFTNAGVSSRFALLYDRQPQRRLVSRQYPPGRRTAGCRRGGDERRIFPQA